MITVTNNIITCSCENILDLTGNYSRCSCGTKVIKSKEYYIVEKDKTRKFIKI